MKSVIWRYKEQKLTRQQAIEKILKIGFKDSDKGWVKSLGSTRLHICQSDGYMTIHRDNDLHTVMGGEKTRKILLKVLAQLQDNKPKLLKYRLQFIVKEFKKFIKKVWKNNAH